jgi:hypothetical protein
MQERTKPIGFWHYPAPGIRTPSAEWMPELLEAQAVDPTAVPDSFRLRLNAGDLSRQYADDDFAGHAAWLDWPWKLHRIERQSGDVGFELYNLEDDPDETTDLVAEHVNRVESMQVGLAEWQASVVRSLNGADYS